MWSGPAGPWNQWPIHASMYQNVPHEQVDWAQLAKQWIQMQQAPSGSEPAISAPHMAPPMAPRVPAPSLHPPQAPLAVPSTVAHKPMPPLGGMPPSGPPAPAGGYWAGPSSSTWVVGEGKPWHSSVGPPPPQGVPPGGMGPPPHAVAPMPPMGVSEKETFDYGHVSSAQPLASQSYDYNHGGGAEQYAQYAPPPPLMDSYPNTGDPYHQYWGMGPNSCPPPFLRKERCDDREEAQMPFFEEEVQQIDAAKRKTLPGWIREGLEKMEREKMRRLERERAEAERHAKLNKHSDEDDPSNTKSKFDSDSDEDKEDVVDMFSDGGHARLSPKRNGAPATHEPSPDDAEPVRVKEEDFKFQTPEERHQELMLKVRRMLTELLLEVTNEEIHSQAQEVFQKAVQKAPARQLRSSSALANITGGLGGLSGYGSDSESSSGGESGEDSDEELERSIRDKRAAFAEWEHQVTEELDEEDRRHERRLQQQQLQAAQKVTEDGGVRSTNRPAEKSSPGTLDHESPRQASYEEPDLADVQESQDGTTDTPQDSWLGPPAVLASDDKTNDKSSRSSSTSPENNSSETDDRRREESSSRRDREKSSRRETAKSSSEKTSSSKKRHNRRSRSTSPAAAPAAVAALVGGAPNDGVGLETGRTGTSVTEVAAAATRGAEAEVTGDEGVAQEVPNVQAGEKTGVRAEVGGADTVLKAQGRVRGPVAKTETDETPITGAETRNATHRLTQVVSI
ncbi:hypothetical protein V5799_032797 [Amblyomma americanum]|uniref:Arginine/serine-rich protein PNISR-like n=1 Tax=Amblyomma americanum TaxID=6943 RepID=A0AAQ4DQ51_AMBAM